MSMNLHAESRGKAIELWQTPTWVTYMALVDCDGNVRSSVKGKEARRAIFIYLEWAKSSLSGTWKDAARLEESRRRVTSHVEYVKDAIADGRIEVYML